MTLRIYKQKKITFLDQKVEHHYSDRVKGSCVTAEQENQQRQQRLKGLVKQPMMGFSPAPFLSELPAL